VAVGALFDGILWHMTRNFKGVWIPASLYLRDDMTWTEKLIVLEVYSFESNALPCFVSNDHLAQFCQVSLSTVEKGIARLVSEGFLLRQRRKHLDKWTRFLRVDTRKISGLEPVKVADKQPENLRPTDINIPNQSNKPKKERKPVNLEACIEGFLAAQSTAEEAGKFWDYYTANGWTQGRGKKIVDWRAAARSWIRRAREFNNKTQNNGFQPSRFDTDALGDYLKHGTR